MLAWGRLLRRTGLRHFEWNEADHGCGFLTSDEVGNVGRACSYRNLLQSKNYSFV